MSEVPPGWEMATVGDVTLPIMAVDPRAAPNDAFVYVDIGSIDNRSNRITDPKSLFGRAAPSRARQLLRSGDTLVSTVRTYLRNIGFVDTSLSGAIGSTGFSVLRPAQGIHPRLLYYYALTNSFVNGLSAQMRGTSYPAVVESQVRSMPIPVPPTAEQERIVAAIEEQFSRLDAGMAAVERARQNLRRMRSSVLQAAITGQLLGGLEVFEERPLGDLIVDIHAGKSFKCNERPALPDEWGVVKVSAMTWGDFRESENKTVLPGRHIDERLEIRPGDVLLSRSNTVGYVGAVVKVERCRPKLLLSDKSLRIVPSPELTPEWLVISLRSKPARRYIEAVATGTSDSMRNISQPKIRALKIPLPTLDVQRRLATEVDRQLAVLTELARTLDVLTRRASSCRSSILAAAFSGELVPQDPRDQSASALVEEITAGRASLKGHKPTHVRQRRTTRVEVLA
jgi:type I restriction enzyme, S subunit